MSFNRLYRINVTVSKVKRKMTMDKKVLENTSVTALLEDKFAKKIGGIEVVLNKCTIRNTHAINEAALNLHVFSLRNEGDQNEHGLTPTLSNSTLSNFAQQNCVQFSLQVS